MESAGTLGASVSRILDRATGPVHAVPSVDHIVERLSRRFGNGSNPKIRQALYRRIAVLCQIKGEEVYKEVCQIAASATSCQKPDRYFCAAISRRLREMGYLSNGVEDL